MITICYLVKICSNPIVQFNKCARIANPKTLNNWRERSEYGHTTIVCGLHESVRGGGTQLHNVCRWAEVLAPSVFARVGFVDEIITNYSHICSGRVVRNMTVAPPHPANHAHINRTQESMLSKCITNQTQQVKPQMQTFDCGTAEAIIKSACKAPKFVCVWNLHFVKN
jgi:hypothetical protein